MYGHEEFASVFKKHQSEAVENLFSTDEGHALPQQLSQSFATLQGISIWIGMVQSLSGGHCLFLFRVHG